MDLVPFIFHEQQEAGSQLCAQHCLNNLLQQPCYTEIDLADVARKLDEAEAANTYTAAPPTHSYNYDDTGFFSISVLETAMQVWDLTLVRWRGEAMRPYQDKPEEQSAFILNLANHWFALRRFGTRTRWYNLNSFLPTPEWISPTYLGMVLSQAEVEGYSVFCVRKAGVGAGEPGREGSAVPGEAVGWGDGGVGELPVAAADEMAFELGEATGRTTASIDPGLDEWAHLGGATPSGSAPPPEVPAFPTPAEASTLAGSGRRRRRQADLTSPFVSEQDLFGSAPSSRSRTPRVRAVDAVESVSHARNNNVVLFRTSMSPDEYSDAFSAAGFRADSIRALDEVLLTAQLEPIVKAGSADWEAVVITSRRAADAWVQSVHELEKKSSARPEGYEPWSNVPVYSPGAAVPTVLNNSSVPPSLRPAPGPTAVNAAGLAPLLLNAPPRGPFGTHRPVLMLTGDKTLPTLSDALAEAGRPYTPVMAYMTTEAAGLERDVRSMSANTQWVALFSPSSAGLVLPYLDRNGWSLRGKPAAAASGAGTRSLKVAAIGDTTATFLHSEGWNVDAVARTPDAAGLVAAIVSAGSSGDGDIDFLHDLDDDDDYLLERGDEDEEDVRAAAARARAEALYAGPTDFQFNSRSYDDEDEALQAALKASMADLPPDFVLPELKPLRAQPVPASSQRAPATAAAAPAPAPVAPTPPAQAPQQDPTDDDIETDDDDGPAQDLSPEDIRAARLARFQ